MRSGPVPVRDADAGDHQVLVPAAGDVPGLALAGLLHRPGLDPGSLADPGRAVPGRPLAIEPPGLLDHLHHTRGAEQRLGVGHGMDEQAAGAGPDQPSLLALISQAVRGLGGQVEGAAGIPDPLDELDGGLAASGDRKSVV